MVQRPAASSGDIGEETAAGPQLLPPAHAAMHDCVNRGERHRRLALSGPLTTGGASHNDTQ
jgi:hypothetical protein